ncbi:MAG: SHOCT domain-containing protein [Nocardioidaceae bacterium]
MNRRQIMLVMALSTIGLENRGWGGPGEWWPVFPIFWLVIAAVVVTTFVLTARRRGRLSGQRAGERRLAERYAAGEIDVEEYRSRLSTLRAESGA